MSYRRITPADRYRIEACLQSEMSIREIAKELRRSPSTILREMRLTGSVSYVADASDRVSKQRKKLRKRRPKIRGKVKSSVIDKIKGDLSPEQISIRLKKKISKQTIYRFIERERAQGNNLMKHLRILRKERHDRKKSSWKPPSERLSRRTWIDERPKVIEKRVRLGDFERDTVFGKLNGPLLLTLVDRTSRYAKIVWVEKKCSRLIHRATVKALKNEVLRSITNDNVLTQIAS